jgi:membrane-associated phospholipid phosphatase
VEPTTAPDPAPFALRRTGALALVLEFFGVVGAFVALSVAAGDPATACRWCATNRFDDAVRRLLVQRAPHDAAVASHALSMIAAPALAFGAVIVPALGRRRGRHALQDSVIVLNAFLLVTGLADGVKKLTDRTRPGVFHGRVGEIEASAAPLEHYVSFFSGDTAWAFVLGAAAATLAQLRGYGWSRRVALAGAAIGAATGVLRVAADMHWATDVLAGAAVGTLVGVALPRLLHGRLER